MISIVDLIGIFFYLALIVLIVVLIIFIIRAIGTLKKVDKLVDDVAEKSSKLDGLFNVVDSATDAFVSVNDKIASFLANWIENLFKRKKGKNE